MKRIITIAVASLMLINAFAAAAQTRPAEQNGKPEFQQKKGEWKEKMEAERIAYLTTAMELTPAEAQVFWPVYNQVDAKKQEAFKAVWKAYRNLKAAAESGTDVKESIDAYVAALEAAKSLDAESVQDYLSVLSQEKVAKLLLAEESFRRTQFQRLGRGEGHKPHANPAPAPER